MHHSAASAKSTSYLPRPAINDNNTITSGSTTATARTNARKGLRASISAATLPTDNTNDENPPASRVCFTITDLLDSKTVPTDVPFPSSGSGMGPLPFSPIRQVVNGHHLSTNNKQWPSATGYVNRLENPENVELFAYASALCHRITGKYIPKTVLQSDETAQRKEIERIQSEPEMLRAIDTIRMLSKQFKDIARDTMGHRKELGHALFRIEESYLKLFEKLLELSLRMYWRYEREHETERAADKASIVQWKELYAWKVSECTKLTKVLEAKDLVLKTQQSQLDDLEQQCHEMRTELTDQKELEAQVCELKQLEAHLRLQERQLTEELTEMKKKHDEMLLYERKQLEEMREHHKHIVDEMKLALREKETLVSKQDKAIRELTAQPPSVEWQTNSTQTEVNDDGLWDIQDGIPRFVSKTTLHRMMWRRFNAFVTCKNCHGRPIPISNKDRSQVSMDSTGQQECMDVWTLERNAKNKSKQEARRIERIEQEWELPAPIVLFLSNLPKSVMAFPFYSLEQVIQQIEAIYDDKFMSDQVDEADGVVREEMPKFISEFFLKTHGLRQSAEIGLYRFLISVKNVYRRSSHVQLFARFLNLLKDDEVDENVQATQQQAKSEVISHTESIVAPTPLQKKRRGYLDRSFLRVFLTARHYLLRPPPVKLPKKKNQKAAPPQHPLEHVIQVEPTKKWVPLNHAIAVLRWFISCLPEDTVVSYCREVEYSTAIYAGRALTEISGNRLAVRAEMRRAMLMNEEGGQSAMASQPTDPKDRHVKPRIVTDVHKVLLLLMDALEQRQKVMETDLIVLFDAGDVNHDCVLSLSEFTSIIRARMPHFSDRRILRMFREALMGSVDQSFALSMDAFVRVCNDHGLVSLLPDDRMHDPFLLQHSHPSADQKETKKPPKIHSSSSTSDTLERTHSAKAVTSEEVNSQQHLNDDTSNEIPEELDAFDNSSDEDKGPISARAEEVEDDEAFKW